MAARQKDLERKKIKSQKQEMITSVAAEEANQTFDKKAFMAAKSSGDIIIKQKPPVFSKKDGFDLVAWRDRLVPVDPTKANH